MYRVLIGCALSLFQALATADLTIEITEGMQGAAATPVAVVPFQSGGVTPPEDVAEIITADLTRSGRFRLLPEKDMLHHPGSGAEVDFRDWRALGQDDLVVGQVQSNGGGGYQIQFELFDVLRGTQLTALSFQTTARGMRLTAHQIADIIYEKLTGLPGVFSTRIAYITEERGRDGTRRLALKIADSDGSNAQTIVASSEPLMSPAWSPDGRRLAYVSFEKKRQSIYIQDIFSGQREQLASFEGINSAPAWSPDGRRLALTLSRDGNPEIYVLDVGSRALTRLTNNLAIDTEPAWSPDGRTLVFTSDRGGSPQIYRMSASGGEAKRLTFQGSYNARARFSPDGRSLVLVTRENGAFRIGLLNLNSGNIQVLTRGPLDESPSFAPNGSMILYGSKASRRGELSAVSIDGRVRQRLAVDAGDVREPAWSTQAR